MRTTLTDTSADDLLSTSTMSLDTTLLIPNGASVRSFLYGSLLPDLTRLGNVTTYAPAPEAARAECELADKLTWRSFIPFRDGALSFFLRRTLGHAHLYWGDTQSMRYARQLRISGSARSRAATRVARSLSHFFTSDRRIAMLAAWHDHVASKLPVVDEYREQFRRDRPGVLFCGHQIPLEVAPPVIAARSLGIPTATFISSWDNLTSKARIAAPFDHFLVWSDLMKSELMRMYPHVDEQHVHVVGSPQFDPYADSTLAWTRDEFCARTGLDPQRPIICYSAGDPNTTPEDAMHVKVLMEQIRGGKIRGNPQVIVRPCPVVRQDEWGRFGPICEQYPEMAYARPDWVDVRPGRWECVTPRRTDVQFLTNLTLHADMNINLASTMTLDFAIRNKPVVNVAFDMADPPIHGVPVWDYYYKFEHYQPVVELGAARFARSPQQLAEHVNRYLDDPAVDTENRRKFVELELGVPCGQSGARIRDTLASIGAA